MRNRFESLVNKILNEQVEDDEEKDLDLDLDASSNDEDENETDIDLDKELDAMNASNDEADEADEDDADIDDSDESEEDSGEDGDENEDNGDETEDNKDAVNNEVFNCLCDVIKKYSSGEYTKEGLLELLNIAVTDELLACYNYLASYALAKTEGRADFVDEFKAHEGEELDHAHDLITRIRELEGKPLQVEWAKMPAMNSNGMKWAQELSQESSEILLNRYYEELGAIKFYAFILDYLHELKKAGEYDSTTHTVIKHIKADEERHALDLRDLLDEYGIEHDDEEATSCDAENDDNNEDADIDDDFDMDNNNDNEMPSDDEEDDDTEDLGDDIPDVDTDGNDDDDFEDEDEDEDKDNF